MAEVLFRARLQRQDKATAWGFRLQGGADYNKPLTLLKVKGDSLAAKGGLHAGDIVVKLAGKSADSMTHRDAQDAIIQSGDALEIIVERADETIGSPVSPPSSPDSDGMSSNGTDALEQSPHSTTQGEGGGADVTSQSGSGVGEAVESSGSEASSTDGSDSDLNISPKLHNHIPSNGPKLELPPNMIVDKGAMNKVNANNNVINMPELTEEDLLNLRVSGEKLLNSVEDPMDSSGQSLSKQNSLETTDDVTTKETPQHGAQPPVEQNSAAVIVEPVLEDRPPPPYPLHMMPEQSDVSGLSQQMLGATVIDNKPPLPPPPAYGAHHHVETNNASRMHSSSSPQQAPPPQPTKIGSPVRTQLMEPEVTEPPPTAEIVYPWRVKKQQILSSRLLARQQVQNLNQNQIDSPLLEAQMLPPPGRQLVHTRVQSDPLSEAVGHPTQAQIQALTQPRPLPKRIYRYVDYVDSGALSDSETGMSTVYRRRRRDDALRPSLTFVGRRIESPAGSATTAPVSSVPNPSLPAKTVFSHLIKPDSRMSPITERGSPLLFVSAPPSGLRKIPAQSSLDSGDEASAPRPPNPPQVVLSAPSPGPTDKPIAEQPLTEDPGTVHQFQDPAPAVQPQGQPVVLQGQPASQEPVNQVQAVVSQSQPVVLQGPTVDPPIQPVASPPQTGVPQDVVSQAPPEVPEAAPAVVSPEQEAAVPGPDQPATASTSNSRSPQSEMGGDHSPRPEDIYFSAAAPDLVDIPMPQVKEMINDLNRRLEAIAAQQPKIAQPPTPQELGLSFEKIKILQQHVQQAEKSRLLREHTGLSKEEEREIIINSKPMPDSTLESLKQRLFGTDITTSATFQKIYDVTSPLTSPPPQRRVMSEERSPSPRTNAARRVHFADPPAQSVIEIEPRNRRERKFVREPLALVSVSNSQPSTTKKDSVGIGSQISRPDNLTVPPTQHAQTTQKSTSPLSEAEVDSQIREEIYAKYSRLKSDIARETLLSPNRNPPSYTSSTVPGAYPSASPQNLPSGSSPQGGSSGINVSIVHQKSDHASPTRQYSFTLPQAQPGHPSHFRYTISARKPSDPVSFDYAFPPSYEESMRMRAVNQGQYRSLDDSFMASSLFSSKPREMHYLQAPAASPLHTGTSPPLSPRVRSRLYVDTASSQGGGLSPTQQLLQRLSPQQQAAAAAAGLIQGPPHPGSTTQGAPQRYTPQNIRSSPVVQSPSMVMNYGHAKSPSHTGIAANQVPNANPPAPPPLPPRESPMPNRHHIHGPGAGLDLDFDLSQSKSFRNLQINFSDGGKMEIPIRVDHHFGSPQQVMQPAAVGRPYLPTQGGGVSLGRGSPSPVAGNYNYTSPVPATPPPTHYHPSYSNTPSPAGSRPPSISYTPPMTYPGGSGAGSMMPTGDMYSPAGPPPAHPTRARSMSVTPTSMMSPEMDQLPPGVNLPPGVFALFDKSFTDKFLQWQSQQRSHFQSETYKLVREMDSAERYSGNPPQ